MSDCLVLKRFTMDKLLIFIVVLEVISQSFGRIPVVDPATPGEFPYQLSLRYRGSFLCGGAILNANTIITSAICAEIGNISGFSIVVGDHNRNVSEGTEQERNISTIRVHDDFDGRSLSNDIALMTLSEPLEFNTYVQPIALPSAGQNFFGNAVITGWGLVGGGSPALFLEKMTVPIVTDDECRNGYGEDLILDSMLCAGTPGRGACQADSGSPLAVGQGSNRILAGILSWGYGCGRPGYPDVYTEVSAFTDWINQKN